MIIDYTYIVVSLTMGLGFLFDSLFKMVAACLGVLFRIIILWGR